MICTIVVCICTDAIIDLNWIAGLIGIDLMGLSPELNSRISVVRPFLVDGAAEK